LWDAVGKEWSIWSEPKSKREAYIPAGIKPQTKPDARQFILDRVHCTPQQAMDLLGMMPDGLEFPDLEFEDLESDFKKSACVLDNNFTAARGMPPV
jgi:hypothetical protein